MLVFEILIGLLLASALLTVLANKLGAPYPALLALTGLVLALLPPVIPGLRLDPELALTLFVAPVLLDAAFDASPRDLRDNWLPVTSLVLAAVGLTVAAVAVVARWLVPDMPWAAAVALGAIVAPPDAAAATAVLRQLSPPHRLLVILESEGLLNDASALLIYRLAVGAAMGGAITPLDAVPLLLLNLVGSVVIGFALARLYLWLTRRLEDFAISIVTQFVSTFAVWIVSDRLGVSPVLTLVVYAAVLARLTALRQQAELRQKSFAVWEAAVYVLNAFAFILVGLQLQNLSPTLPSGTLPFLTFGLAILGTVIVVRLFWVGCYNGLARVLQRLVWPQARETMVVRSYKNALVVGWCGMRGLLTLATALALPLGGSGAPGFPHRDLLIVAAYTVVVGTLLLQGLTVGPLLRFLELNDDGAIDRERVFARQQAVRAALTALEGNTEPEAAILRKEYAVQLRDDERRGLRPATFGQLRLKAIRAERHELHRLRRNLEIGDDAYHAIEEELDWAEGNARRRARAVEDVDVAPGDG